MKNAEDGTPSLPYVSKDNVTDSVVSVDDYLKDFELNTTWWFTHWLARVNHQVSRNLEIEHM